VLALREPVEPVARVEQALCKVVHLRLTLAVVAAALIVEPEALAVPAVAALEE
jgi:hypothetical protein